MNAFLAPRWVCRLWVGAEFYPRLPKSPPGPPTEGKGHERLWTTHRGRFVFGAPMRLTGEDYEQLKADSREEEDGNQRQFASVNP